MTHELFQNNENRSAIFGYIEIISYIRNYIKILYTVRLLNHIFIPLQELEKISAANICDSPNIIQQRKSLNKLIKSEIKNFTVNRKPTVHEYKEIINFMLDVFPAGESNFYYQKFMELKNEVIGLPNDLRL